MTLGIVVFPHKDVALGVVDAAHELVSGYAESDGWVVRYAMILSDLKPASTGL